MQRALRYLAPASLGLLMACSVTVGVRAQMEVGRETWRGTVTGYMNRSGVMRLVSSTGVTAEGEWVFSTRREGIGTLKTSDGRAGKFQFVSTGQNGTGFGDIAGQNFVFTFGGKVDRESPQAEEK